MVRAEGFVLVGKFVDPETNRMDHDYSCRLLCDPSNSLPMGYLCDGGTAADMVVSLTELFKGKLISIHNTPGFLVSEAEVYQNDSFEESDTRSNFFCTILEDSNEFLSICEKLIEGNEKPAKERGE